MQPLNASPLKPSLGLPIPASPADSGFLPRREFLPSSSKRPLSTFALLAFCNTSSIRLSAFPPPIIHLFHKFFDDRKLLKLFRDNKSPLKHKESIDRDAFAPTDKRTGLGAGRSPGEDEDLAEFTLTAKFWANTKSLETEKLLVQLLVLLNSQGYSLLTSIDFGREPGDKLTLVFERPAQYQSPTQYINPAITNGSTPYSGMPSHHHQNSTGSASGSASALASGGPVKQLLFGISFTSQTSFRCINPPLESTPGILQALRNAWPRGIENETKISDGCYEFKLKGYSFFAEDTFQTDSLELILSLLKSLQRLQFTLAASVSLTSSHAKNKDLWIFSTSDTDALSPSQVLSSISASPVSYANGMPVGLSGGTIREKEGSHLRSASVDAFQQNQQAISTPGHQRNATTPVFGTSGSGTIGSAAGGTFGRSAGGPQTPRSQGSVLVKKHPSAKASPKPNNDGTVLPLVTAVTEAGSTPPGTGNKSTTPPKAPTPPGTAVKPVGMMSPGGPKPLGSKYPYQQGPGQGQGQAVLYSTPTSGNVLYSTPPSSPPAGSYNSFPGSPSAPPGVPPHHPNDGNWNPTPSITSGSTMRPSSPNKHLLPASGPEDDGPTPPLLSSAAFRDTISDQDTVRESSFSGGTGKPGGGGSSASMMSGRSAESYDVPVMWTGSGGLASVGMAAAGALGTTIEEDEREVSPTSPGVPGGWVNDPSPNAANAAAAAARRNSREARSSKEKERAFEAKVDGAQLVTVQPASFEAAYANAGILGADQTSLGRKSQEVVVQTVPGAETKESSKANGWVMVNVSGSGGESRPEHKKSSSTANVRPPPGPLRAVNASPQSSSSLDTPPPAVGRTSSANMAPPTSYNLGDLPPTSGGESSSSVDNSAPPSSTGHGNPTAPGTTNAAGGKRSGFRRLFSRDKGEKKSDERMRTGAIEISAGSSPKKGKKGNGEDAPQRASGKMSID